jgi:thiol-disulfide isomerase/thioredoxin
MNSSQFVRCAIVSIGIALPASCALLAAEAPNPQQALKTFTPIQSFVEYSIPTKEEAAGCTIRPEKENNATSWMLRNAEGEVLRRFADTNNDNVVDMWCYYLDGLEVYRDIDSNFNQKADQYRWFHTGGTRWGIDKNEDGRIDEWRKISPHEVAEQVIFAIKNRDAARFNLLLLTPAELNELGLGKQRTDRIAEMVKAASSGFSKLVSEQKVVTPESRYADFGSSRPAIIPIGSEGATKEVTVCDNSSALVQTAGKHEQVYVGTLVAVGDRWKLIDLPAIGAENQPQTPGIFIASNTQAAAGGTTAGEPTEAMQKLMAELERLDGAAQNLPPEKLEANIDERAKLLTKLADESKDNQWLRQLADMYSSSPKGPERLAELLQRLDAPGADEQLISHVAFQKMWAEYVLSQQQPNADAAKIQEKWLADLQAFVGKYPKSADTAEALLQLGMYQEFVGKSEEARKWYQQLVANFPSSAPGAKAAGAIRRLTSAGKPIPLRGKDLVSGAPVDLAAAPYRGKIVLIHYWATWCDSCKADMVLLKDFYAKKGGRDFEIIGVCLDNAAAPAKQYLTQNRFPWKHLHEPGGLDGRLANEMGVMTPPLMMLVDQTGKVVNQNIQVPELEAEFAKVQKPQGNANALRGTTPPR